jgi:hypothetical protein
VKQEEKALDASFDFSAEGRLQTQGFEINVSTETYCMYTRHTLYVNSLFLFHHRQMVLHIHLFKINKCFIRK